MFDLLLAGVISAVAMIFILLKLDMQKVCGYDIYVDIGFTTALMLVFAGTFSGMMAAITGGAIISIFLYIMGRLHGRKRIIWSREKRLHWKYFA